MSPEQAEVHRKLCCSLPVRTVVSHDDPDHDASRKRQITKMRRAQAARLLRPRNYVSPIQRARARELVMLDRMKSGAWYSAKVLAAWSGIEDKTFFTHVKRMVKRGTLMRAGSRHSYRYRKHERGGR